MVTINLTLFIEVGLFLVFLWAMNRLVFRPLLNVMDGRDEKRSGDLQVAREAGAEADQLEKQYASESVRIHHEASREVVRAHRQAQEAHFQRLAELKQRGEEELNAVQREVSEAMALERKNYEALAVELAEAMAEQLAGKGNAA